VKEITTVEQNFEFCTLIESMLKTHKVIIPLLVTGVHESQSYMDQKDLNKFMNETLQSRVSRRVLAEQHLSLSRTFNDQHNPGQIGVVDSQCKAFEIVQKCVKRCDELFMNSYEELPPKVEIDGHLDTTFTYIPEHIEYIIFEILKNSMRYTQERHLGGKLPSVRITIGKGDHRVMFRISDQGLTY
jgi:pyruvate dehydrogenase kinase 2/3/4